MIDLLKNYKDLNNAAGYTGSVRYYLAKKKLDVFPAYLDSICKVAQSECLTSIISTRQGEGRQSEVFIVHS